MFNTIIDLLKLSPFNFFSFCLFVTIIIMALINFGSSFLKMVTILIRGYENKPVFEITKIEEESGKEE